MSVLRSYLSMNVIFIKSIYNEHVGKGYIII